MPTFRTIAVLLIVLSATASAGRQAMPKPAATAAASGVSWERLKRLDAVLQEHIDQNRIAGIVVLALRDGKPIYERALGWSDKEASRRMTMDTVFRIASQTKALTSAAILALMEDGRLTPNMPVSNFIPAYATTTVAAKSEAGVSAVPARRPITIADLLTHTAGISYGTGALEGQYKANNVYMWYFADKDEAIGASMERLAALPFAAQPGERWVYGFASDLLGAVIEKASGLPLDEFFRTRIFEPLRMPDSSFYLPPAKVGRLATVYSAGSGGLTRAPDPGRGQGDYVTGPRKAFSGGAGVLSTATDYARFLQMLLNGGELDGVRLLGPKTVELMTSNHVGNLYLEGRLGFGLGFEIVEHVGRSGRPGSVGEYGWGGAYYTKFWVDPVEKVVAVFMTQLLPSAGGALQDQFRVLVNQAIVQSEARH